MYISEGVVQILASIEQCGSSSTSSNKSRLIIPLTQFLYKVLKNHRETGTTKVIELQKQVDGLTLRISDYESKFKTMRSKEMNLNNNYVQQFFVENAANQAYYSYQNNCYNYQTSQLNSQLYAYQHENSNLKSTIEARNEIWNATAEKFLKEKNKLAEDLNNKSEIWKLEKEDFIADISALDNQITDLHNLLEEKSDLADFLTSELKNCVFVKDDISARDKQIEELNKLLVENYKFADDLQSQLQILKKEIDETIAHELARDVQEAVVKTRLTQCMSVAEKLLEEKLNLTNDMDTVILNYLLQKAGVVSDIQLPKTTHEEE